MARAPVIRSWDGIDAEAELCGGVPSPAAAISLLLAMDSAPLEVAMCYAQPALMFEGNTAASGTTRTIGVMVPPCAQHGRLRVTRCTTATADEVVAALLSYMQAVTDAPMTPQAASTCDDGQVAAAVFGSGWVAGPVAYLAASTPPSGMTVVIDSAQTPNDAAAFVVDGSTPYATDRALVLCDVDAEAVAPALVSQVVELTVTNCAGLGVEVTEYAADMELL